MIMNKLIALTALSASTVSATISSKMEKDLAGIQRDGIAANSPLGRKLIGKSRLLDADYANDISFVADYSIKFMGCHHVTQWASEEEQQQDDDTIDENLSLNAANGKIKSKGLVRFRLCPSDSCFEHFGVGCSSNYGEYVVDMRTFLEAYVEWQMDQASYMCSNYRSTCYKECFESATANCYTSCYNKYGVNAAFCSNKQQNNYGDGEYSYDDYVNNDFTLADYLECGEYAISNANGEELSRYLGPYCSTQGGDIRLGFFQDKFCSLPSSYQADYFKKLSGVEIPYTHESIVTTKCMPCKDTSEEQQQKSDYYNYDADGNRNYYVASQVNDMCGTVYMQSGKCEKEFNKDDVAYPEEGACSYIDGIKRMKNDGILRAQQRIGSTPASVAIGMFTGMAAGLGGYVYHLKSKIARSRVNLAGATTSLA